MKRSRVLVWTVSVAAVCAGGRAASAQTNEEIGALNGWGVWTARLQACAPVGNGPEAPALRSAAQRLVEAGRPAFSIGALAEQLDRARTAAGETEFERRQMERMRQGSARALSRGQLGAALQQERDIQRWRQMQNASPQRVRAREEAERLQREIIEITRRGWDESGMVQYRDVRNAYLQSLMGRITGATSPSQLLAVEQELEGVGTCVPLFGDEDQHTAVSAQLDAAVGAAAPAFRAELQAAASARDAASFEARTAHLTGSRRLAANPTTAGIVNEARTRLAALREADRLASEREASRQALAASAAAERARQARRAQMTAQGPDADALSQSLAYSYLHANPRADLGISTGMMQLQGNQLRIGVLGVEQNDSFHVRGVSCRRQGSGFDCSYEFEYRTARSVLGIGHTASSGWISRRDRFVANGDTWRSTAVDGMFAGVWAERFQAGPSQASAGGAPDPACQAARMGAFGRGAGVAMGIGACNAAGN